MTCTNPEVKQKLRVLLVGYIIAMVTRIVSRK